MSDDGMAPFAASPFNPGEGGGNRGLVAHVGSEDRDPVQARRSQSAARGRDAGP